MKNEENALNLIDCIDLVEDCKITSFRELMEAVITNKVSEVDIDEVIKSGFIDEDTIDQDALTEAKVITKINSKGQRRKKLLCGKGKKLVNGACVAITGSEKVSKKLGAIKMKKTKKALGASAKQRTVRLAKKAKLKRKQQGL